MLGKEPRCRMDGGREARERGNTTLARVGEDGTCSPFVVFPATSTDYYSSSDIVSILVLSLISLPCRRWLYIYVVLACMS